MCFYFDYAYVVFSFFFFSPLPVDVPLPTTPSYFKTFPNYPGANVADQSNLPSEPKNLHAAIVSKQFVTLKWNVPEKTGPLTEKEPLIYSVFWKEKDSQR